MREHTARKQHSCSYCEQRIEAGDRYLECFLFPSEDAFGDGGQIKVHPLCNAFWNEVVGPESDWEPWDWEDAKKEHGWDEWLAKRAALAEDDA
jgi:hypothetical protein